MPNIGVPELVIILVIALLVLGPGRLPSVAQSLGKSIREFRKAASDVQEAASLDVAPPPAASPAPAPVAPAPVAPPVVAAPAAHVAPVAAPPPNTLTEAAAPNVLSAPVEAVAPADAPSAPAGEPQP